MTLRNSPAVPALALAARGLGSASWCRRTTGPFRVRLLVASVALALVWAPATAQTWKVIPSISLTETWSDNINLADAEFARSDLVTQVTPGLTFSGRSSRATVDGTVSVPFLFYLDTGSFNDDYFPLADVRGRVEAIEKFFYVEGLVSVTQPFITPFGAQPDDLTNATENRYTSSVYRVSPYIQGGNPSVVQYLLRNDSTWANLDGAPINTSNSYTSEWRGTIDTPVAPLGWHAEFDLVNVKFKGQDPQRTNVARVGPRYAFNPVTRLAANIGYEDNRYPLSDYAGAVYGVGIEWQPTERTKVVGGWEHRFFGSSYLFTFDHRTPLSVWNFTASRVISSYPQQLGTLPSGSNVPVLLDQLFVSRIADPVQRQQAVSAFIDSRGLPTELSGPVNVYTQQITLDQNLRATMGLLGVRNSLFITVFQLNTQPITGSGVFLPPALSFGNDNTQLGANVAWTHNLTPLTSVSLTANALRTEANGAPYEATSQESVRLAITSPLSPNTSVFGGVRYQSLRSDVPGTEDYTESAIFAGISHSFR